MQEANGWKYNPCLQAKAEVNWQLASTGSVNDKPAHIHCVAFSIQYVYTNVYFLSLEMFSSTCHCTGSNNQMHKK